MTLLFLLPISGGAICRLKAAAGRRRCRCRRVVDGAVLATNDADDVPVGEEEERRRHDEMPDKHRQRVGAVHGRSRPHEPHAPASDECRRRPGRDEVAADAVDPRQQDPGVRHPATVVVPVDHRLDYLHVAFGGDDDQTEDGTVRSDGHNRFGLEQETDDPLAGRRRRLEPAEGASNPPKAMVSIRKMQARRSRSDWLMMKTLTFFRRV